MKVLKFGGSSVANAECIQEVMQIIGNHLSPTGLIVVVSALGGVTDLLVKAGQEAVHGYESYQLTFAQIKERIFLLPNSYC